jgi:hypothetical protein
MRRALLLFFLTACGDEPGPRPARYAYIHNAIIVPSCATSGCHSTLSSTADLVLDDEAEIVRQRLIDKGFVFPDVVEASPLLYYLRGEPYVEKRMPPDAPLPKKDVALIERWISVGAPP